MGRRIFTGRVVAIVGCLAFVGVVLVLLGWFTLNRAPGGPPLTLAGAGQKSVGPTAVQFVVSDHRIALAIWRDDTTGSSSLSPESGLFTSSVQGDFSLADGRRITWSWHAPREKGGDFEMDGTPYDLANGTLFLVSTKNGQVRVTQLDVNLSQVQPNTQGIEALAKKEARIAKFIAEASGKK